MIKKLIQFSMDLYDIESGATVSVESDHLIINFGGARYYDVLFPEIVHDSKAVEFEIVKRVMELIEKYEEDSK